MRTFLAILIAWLLAVSPAAAQLTTLGAGRGGPAAGGGSFTTLDPSNTTVGGPTLSPGNLILTAGGSGSGRSLGVSCQSTGKYYFEARTTTTTATNDLAVGVANATKALGPGGDSWPGGADQKSSAMFNTNGALWYYSGAFVSISLQAFPNPGDTVGVHVDVTNHLISFETGAGTSATFATPPGTICPYVYVDTTSGAAITANFGASAWTYGPGVGEVVWP